MATAFHDLTLYRPISTRFVEATTPKASHLEQKLPVVQEVGPQHLGHREHPLRVRHAGENLLLEKLREDRRSLGALLRQGYGGAGHTRGRVPGPCRKRPQGFEIAASINRKGEHIVFLEKPRNPPGEIRR